MTLIEKAQGLHEPENRDKVRDADLLHWVAALPAALALVEEVQYLRRELVEQRELL